MSLKGKSKGFPFFLFHHRIIRTNIDEDIYFDTERFIALCESMSELTPEQVEVQKKKKRAFVFHKNLDVKAYWENRGTGVSTSDLLFI